MLVKKLRKIGGSAWRNIKQNERQRFALYDESAFVITTQHVFFFFLSLVKPCHFQWTANNSWISTSCGRKEVPSDSDLREWVVNRTNKKDQKRRNMYFLGMELTIFRRRFLLNGRDTSNNYYWFANQSRFYRLRICTTFTVQLVVYGYLCIYRKSECTETVLFFIKVKIMRSRLRRLEAGWLHIMI